MLLVMCYVARKKYSTGRKSTFTDFLIKVLYMMLTSLKIFPAYLWKYSGGLTQRERS